MKQNLLYTRAAKSSRSIIPVLLLINVLGFILTGLAQGTQTFNAGGTFNVPAGVSSVTIECWGAGGGGASGSNAAGGGGGGAYTKGTISGLTGGTSTITITVGATAAVGSNGTASSAVFSANNITANGGNAGNARTGGSGGAASVVGGIITASFAGGDGGNAMASTSGNNNEAGGGGGGSALTTGPGSAGSNGGSTNTATPGGNGTATGGRGSGANGSQDATAGTQPGSGGGGRGEGNSTSKSGGAGRVVVTWVPGYLAQFTTSSTGSSTWCAGETRNVTVTVKNIGQATWTDASPDVNIGATWNNDGVYAYKVDAGGLAPGATQTYTIAVTAPSTAGAASLTFDVIKESDCQFAANSGNCGPGNSVLNVTGITIAAPADKTVTAQAATICTGSSTNIQVASSVSGVNYQLRNNSNNSNIGSPVAGTGGTINLPTGTLSSSTTFNVLATTVSTGCTLQLTNTPTVTVNAKSTDPASASATSNPICNGQSTQLSLSGGGGGTGTVIKWYSTNCGTGSVGTGNNLSVSPTTTTTYYGRYEDPSPCSINTTCASVTVTVNQKPTAPSSATATPSAICNGQSSILSISGGSAGTTGVLKWYSGSCGGTFVGTGNNLSVGPGSTTTYYARYEDAAPCNILTVCASVTLTVNTPPTVTPGSSPDVCQSATPVAAALTGASFGGGATTAAWSITSGGGTLSSTSQTANPSAVTYKPANNFTGTVTLTLTSSTPAGCTAASNTRTIDVNPLPASSISFTETSGTTNNDGTICNGDQVTLTANPTSGMGYSWAAPISATGNNKVVNPSSTTSYTVTVTNSTTGCSATATSSVTVNTLPAATISFSESFGTTNNDGIICAGNSVTLIANPTSGMTYNWAAPISATGNNKSVSPASTNIYTVTVTNSTTNCSAVANGTVTVNNPPTPTITFSETSGNANNDGIICKGASVTLTANPTAASTYAWAAPVGGTGNNKSVSPTSTTSYTVTVTTTATNCSASVSSPVTVNALPTPGFILAPTPVCVNTAGYVYSTQSSQSNYQWTISGGTINSGGTTSSTTASVTWTATGTKTISINYTDVNKCSAVSPTTQSITVEAPPAITAPPVGGTICLGSSMNLSVTATPAGTSYQWQKDGVDIGGATSSSYSIANVTGSDEADYSVEVSNSCSTATSTPATITVTSAYNWPFTEDFESITIPNQLPHCVTTTNLGSKTFTRTYGGIGARSGTDFGSWGNNANDWFFTPGINLTAGVKYEFNYWYWTDNTSAFTSMGAAVGTTPTVAAMTTPVGTTRSGSGLGAIQVYQQYRAAFTPTSTGVYYFGAHVTTNPGASADKVVIDDIGVNIACTGTPTAGTATVSCNLVTAGTTDSLSLTGYTTGPGGIDFQWQSSPAGANTWSNINGATATTYSPIVNSSTDFRCKVTCFYSNQSDFSNTVRVTVANLYKVTGGACIPATVGLNGSQTGVNYQLVLNGNTNMGSPVAGTGNPISFGPQIDSGIYTVLASIPPGNCTVQMTAVATVDFCTSTWVGVTDTNWNEPTNWNPAAVPNNCYVNIVIHSHSPHNPHIGVEDISVRNMDIDAGVKINLDTKNLFVCGRWTGGTGDKAVVMGDGIVYISGSIHQGIVAFTQFDNLQINNVLGVTLQSGSMVSIRTGLLLQTGNLDVSAGSLRLLSTAANNNSYIDNFTTGFTGSITGMVSAERYIPVQGYNQHYMSSPVSSPPIFQMGPSGTEGKYVTPTTNCDETQLAYGSEYGSIFQYNDGHVAPGKCMLGNWMIKAQGNMENGRGYSSYQTGGHIRTLTGLANTGNITVSNLNNSGYPTINTAQGQPIESGWNLVGNPYPSSLDLTVDRTIDGFDNQVQIWQTTGPYQGTWQPVVINGTHGRVIVPPFQAFLVHIPLASTGLHSYKFYQSERTRATNLTFYRTQAENSLSLQVDYNGLKDITSVEFNPEATSGFDAAYDANKYDGNPGRPTLYTTNNTNTWYAINTLPTLKDVTTVPMGLRAEATGTMTLTPGGLESFDPTTYIFLEDKKTNTWHNLRDGAYTFTTAKTDNRERFVLHFTPPASILTTDASCDGAGMINIEQPGDASWSYSVTDNSNTTVATGSLNNSSPVSIAVNTGVYMLTLRDNNGYTVTKSVIVGGPQTAVAAFTSNTQTSQVKDDIIFTSSLESLTYSWNFGDEITATGKNCSHSYSTEGVYPVTLTVTNTQGCSAAITHPITVTSRSVATNIGQLPTDPALNIWSHENSVYVDFSKQSKVDAEIELYNVLGQMINSEKFGKATVYSKQLSNISAVYLIVKVKNDDKLTTKKLFLNDTE